MLAADPPPAIAEANVEKPADVVVVSRDTRTEVLASRDTPLPLTKAARSEDALLRQAVFLTSTFTVVRPANATGPDVLQWTYQSYLQRQLCVSSITGQFSCAIAEVEELSDKGSGEAPLVAAAEPAATGAASPAETARIAVTTGLRNRASGLFEADRRLKVIPMLKAAGVTIRQSPAPASTVRR